MTWDGKVRATFTFSADIEFSDFGPFTAEDADRAEAIARFHVAEYLGNSVLQLADNITTEILEE